MRIFAIESSCDETAAAILDATETESGHKLRLLSNVVSTQIPIHALYGGVVPEIASRAHAESISGVVRQSFTDAGVTPSDIDAVAVTYAPGLIGSLLVGVFASTAINTVHAGVEQFFLQLLGIVVVAAWSFGATWGILKVISHFGPIRVSYEQELEGLDEALHGESAYRL